MMVTASLLFFLSYFSFFRFGKPQGAERDGALAGSKIDHVPLFVWVFGARPHFMFLVDLPF